MELLNLKDMSVSQLEEYFKSIDEKPFRAKQVFQWIYRGVTSFDDMTDLSKDLREKLKKTAIVSSLKIVTVQESASDGTKKFLFELADGNRIESVFMKYKYGNSICISSQAGCRMGCSFCASTKAGLDRNLTPGEIADQIICAERYSGEAIGHIVVMGSGEPFDNYDNLSMFIKNINDKNGMNIGMRNITVSTCGLIPGIERFGDDFPQVNLAVSLHSVQDELRNEMMPVNKKYNVHQLVDACKEYVTKTGRRVTFEYTLISGKNDSKNQIDLLAKTLRGINCHVNLIPLNSVSESNMQGSNRKLASEIAKHLENVGIQATVRRELGADIDAACGQLRLSKKTINTI